MADQDMNLVPYINDFANRSFRDLADQDYIAARMCHRTELDQQFLWNSLQAIEKYLKAILLYSRKGAKGLRHDLIKALAKVQDISDIQVRLPHDVVNFIKYLNRYGPNRYLVYPTHLRDRSLLELDKSVWYVRRYCYYMRGEIRQQDGTTFSRLEGEVQKVHHPEYEGNPHKYRIFGGYLERILDQNLPAAEHLIWKNFYFGRRRKRRIRSYRLRMSSVNPTHSLRPEVFPELDRLVDFPREVRTHFCRGAS